MEVLIINPLILLRIITLELEKCIAIKNNRVASLQRLSDKYLKRVKAAQLKIITLILKSLVKKKTSTNKHLSTRLIISIGHSVQITLFRLMNPKSLKVATTNNLLLEITARLTKLTMSINLLMLISKASLKNLSRLKHLNRTMDLVVVVVRFLKCVP